MAKRIAVIGAGMGGLCAAILAREAGHDVTIYEHADSVGGTWRANRYPGVACDVPAILYQFSFAPNHNWSHNYARGPEIHAYTKSLVDQFDLGGSLHLNEGVTRATWDPAAKHWTVETEKGALETFDAIVPALGQLSRPTLPDITGVESFKGAKFHAAEWPDGIELTGKRVGVIGSAASAVQFIPEVAKDAAALVVFQRTANWVIPRNDLAVTDETKVLMATNLPVAMRLGAQQRAMIFDNADTFFWQAFQFTPEGRAAFTRTALDHLEEQVPDAELRAKLIPDYPIGCKRILITDDFYPALMRDNVTLETNGIVAVEQTGVRTTDSFHDLDVLIFATGFETTAWNWSMEVVGAEGRTLKETWKDGPEAYLGIMVHGFPNMFMLYGPNTNLGHNSISFMIEAQVGYMLKALAAIETDEAQVAEVTADGQRRFNDRIAQLLSGSVWADPHCKSWYKAANGRVYQNWSGNCAAYAEETAEVDREAVALV
ncbi:NAD(P)/FAD-dependent oxidoreductase [Sphingomonas sp. SUN019]|uniref:flavin-containing monooxygenase n=1 Tax=Sphingomonas sp. SUN019 TaxID=2937788 RepID=UPI0021649CEB|nr:NAD(P)/FAD-dependent oxidoreductase [Sphingomonas sp. SUN019]UVO50542.1 NAD(P)/FAD-dependent oxidoreductase [Sphingomonas sp. SUN019]